MPRDVADEGSCPEGQLQSAFSVGRDVRPHVLNGRICQSHF